jgi:hypothetical protein
MAMDSTDNQLNVFFQRQKQALLVGVSTLSWWGGFEYARDPESYTSGSVTTGRASFAGQVKG